MDNINEQVLFDALGDPEALDKALSRRQAFGSMGGWGKKLALASVPFGLAALTREAFAQQAFTDTVVNALNFALTLERLEAEFYSMVLASGVVPQADRGIFELITANEIAHRDFLEGLLGAQAARRPQFDFTVGGTLDPFNDYPTTLILTQGFEDAGVRAYKGQLGALQGNAVALTMGARIHSVEARQASLVRRLRGERVAPANVEAGPWKGWPGQPLVDQQAAPFISAIYAGEDNVVHAGVNVATLAAALTGDEAIDNPMVAAQEAFDEPLGLREVLAIAGMFGQR
ncbi:hypothetical protein BH23GEM3_BH23GEM3_07060 [soil metagenome]|nr:ferritin-like domain-containing protein [Gemmatimonadota bacterium]